MTPGRDSADGSPGGDDPPDPDPGPDRSPVDDRSPAEDPAAERPPADDSPDVATRRDSASGTNGLWTLLDRLREQVTAADTVRIVVAIAAVALLVRLVGLGTRPMHYDEARVGSWILHYLDSGSFHYRHSIHGPLIQHVNRWLFAAVGANDFVARLPVAVAGGLLPLGALLFREHLRKSETVALALFLGFNSILLYYSRFMRSDMLLAALAFGAVGLLVRAYDTRDVRYLYGVAVFTALGLATKENALVYVLTWLGATALLADAALYRPRSYRSGLETLRASWVGRLLAGVRATLLVPVRGVESLRERFDDPRAAYGGAVNYAFHAVAILGVFLLVVVFMYADRGAGMAGIERPPTPPAEGAVGFWEALSRPLSFPGYAVDTLAAAVDEATRWGGRSGLGSDDGIIETWIRNVGIDLKAIGANAAPLAIFAVLGFVYERYGRSTSRNLVMFFGYCGFVSVLGYPLADDIGSAHWLHVHILVPLAIPAAVAVAGIYRWGRSATVRRDGLVAGLVLAILLLTSGWIVAVNADTVYGDSTSRNNEIAQYAQAQPEFHAVEDALRTIGGTDRNAVVAYVGQNFSDNPIISGQHPWILEPQCFEDGWYNSFPLPWYMETAGANATCERDPAALRERVAADPPSLIVTHDGDRSAPRTFLEERYVPHTVDMYQYGHEFTYYLHEDWVDRVPGWPAAA